MPIIIVDSADSADTLTGGLVRTRFYRAPNRNAYPRGVEAVFEYNGLTLNDRRRPDTLRVTGVDGLDDADVRDVREDNPDRDGESIFNSLYGGRTITLKGKLESGSIDGLRNLEYDLITAFSDLNTEYPLHIRWLDFSEEWQDSSAYEDWAFDTGAGTLNIQNGVLAASTTDDKRVFMNRPRFLYADGMVVQRFTTGPSATPAGSQYVQNLHKRLDSTDYLFARLKVSTAQSVALLKSDGGVHTALTPTIVGSIPTFTTNTTYWLVSYVVGNIFTVEFWLEDPFVGDTWVLQATHTLTGANAAKYGADISGQQGFYSQNMQAVQSWTTDAVELISLNPGDLVSYCKKIAKIEITETQADMLARREFMVTLRASDPLLQSRIENVYTISPTTTEIIFPGGGGGLTLPLLFAADVATVTNRGTKTALPKFKFYGPMTNPGFGNFTTNEFITLTTDIADGHWIEVDVANRTVIDDLGTNVYSTLTGDYEWWGLLPGENEIGLGVDAFDTNAKIEIRWRHSF